MKNKKREREREREEPKTVPFIIRNIPRELHEDFKKWCDKRGYSMAGRIRRFMNDCVTNKHH